MLCTIILQTKNSLWGGCCMKPIFHNLLALAGGIAVSMVLITAVQVVNSMLFPLPEGIDIYNIEDVQALWEAVPFGSMMMVELSYLLGSLGGGYIIGTFAKSNHALFALVLGALLTIANVVNIMSIPHPLWMAILTMVTFIPATFLGCYLAQKLK